MESNAGLDGFMVHPLDLFPSNKYLNSAEKISTNTATLDGFKVHPIDLFVSNAHHNNYNFNNNIPNNYNMVNNQVNNNNMGLFPSGQILNSGSIYNNYQNPTNIEAYKTQIQSSIFNNGFNDFNSFNTNIINSPETYQNYNTLNINNQNNLNNNAAINNQISYVPLISSVPTSNIIFPEPKNENINNINYTQNISYVPKNIVPDNPHNIVQLPKTLIHNTSEYESYIPNNNYNNIINYSDPLNQNINQNNNKIYPINSGITYQNYPYNNTNSPQNSSTLINNNLNYNPVTNSNLITSINYVNTQQQLQPVPQSQAYYLPQQNQNIYSSNTYTKNISQYPQNNFINMNLNNINNRQTNLLPLNNVVDLNINYRQDNFKLNNSLKQDQNLIKNIPYNTSSYEPDAALTEYQTRTSLNGLKSNFNLMNMNTINTNSLQKRSYTSPKLLNNQMRTIIIPKKETIIVPIKKTILIPEDTVIVPSATNNILTSTIKTPMASQFIQPIVTKTKIKRNRNNVISSIVNPPIINTINYNTNTATPFNRSFSNRIYNPRLISPNHNLVGGRYFNPISSTPLKYNNNTFYQSKFRNSNINNLKLGRLVYKPRNYNNIYFK